MYRFSSRRAICRRAWLGLVIFGALFPNTATSENTALSASPAAPAGLAPFKCYTLRRMPFTPRVASLRDQFGDATVRVRAPRELCSLDLHHGVNVTYTNASLACYGTTDVGPRTSMHVVRLRNKFGSNQTTHTTGQQSLCAPSVVRLGRLGVPGYPPYPVNGLDDFRCYGLKSVRVTRIVTTSDAFSQRSGSSGIKTRVFSLVRLCNPARLTYGGMTTPIGRPAAHLACYTIRDVGSADDYPFRPFPGQDVIVRNQLRRAEPLRALRSETLCLPTFVEIRA
jgi:hypothetical protein